MRFELPIDERRTFGKGLLVLRQFDDEDETEEETESPKQETETEEAEELAEGADLGAIIASGFGA